MIAVVLAGGLGTRLRPLVRDRPKSMVEIAGRPFLEYLLLLLRKQNVHDVVLCTGYMASSVRRHFGSGVNLGMSLRYSEEKTPLGTGGALKFAEPMLDDARFIVLNGDSFFPVPLDMLVQSHIDRGSLGTLALTRVKEAGRYGSVTLGTDGAIQAFVEKAAPGPALISGGCYVFERQVLDFIKPGATASLERDVFPALVRDGLLGGKSFDTAFVDIGVPADYQRLQEHPEQLLATID